MLHRQDIYLVEIYDGSGSKLWDGIFLYCLQYSDVMVAVREGMLGPSIPLMTAMAEGVLSRCVPFSIRLPEPGNAIEYDLAGNGKMIVLATRAYNVDLR
jgi:hypothetical protein